MSNATFTTPFTTPPTSPPSSSQPPPTTPTLISTTPSVPASSSSNVPPSTTPSSSAPPPSTTSIVSVTPSTTVVVTTPSTTVITSGVTVTQSTITQSGNGSTGVVITTITTTAPASTVTPSVTDSATRSSSTSASPTALATDGSAGGSNGLSSGAKIAIAVVIPVVVVAAAFLLGLLFWRKRKAKKAAEEQRKDEMAEYGFNPNNDPSLAPIGAYTEGTSVAADDAGYRGWGTTNSNTRKASTTMGSNSRAPVGMAFSDNGSQPGGYTYQPSPNAASDQYSSEPLMNGHPEGKDGVAALGGAAVAGGAVAAAASKNNRNSQADIHRGPSNASSSYSHGAPQSESSNDMGSGGYYHDDAPYNVYNDTAQNVGPYGDGTYGGSNEQPIIRDVQARRNTRIERAPTFPQTQGGIAQNF